MITLKDKVKALMKEEKHELNAVRCIYRTLIEEARRECPHDYSEWFMTPNEEFRYDIHHNIIWLRDCKLCGKTETRHGEG